LKEGFDAARISVTGNTVMDAPFMVVEKTRGREFSKDLLLRDGDKLVLVTAHRMQSFGGGLENICHALRRIADSNGDIEIAYPIHLNPSVPKSVNRIVRYLDRIHFIEPLGYVSFVQLMNGAYLILTDSGGIQEEAQSLKKPVPVVRNTTRGPRL
jgi:UDP-N-acetylglucosamine 2-epimerase (non-hydrolysing)